MEYKSPFALKSATLVLAMSALLIGCGGGDGTTPQAATPPTTAPPTTAPPINSAPTMKGALISMPTAADPTYTVAGADADGDTLTYSITAQPAGTVSATIDASTGVITFTGFDHFPVPSFMIVEVSDGVGTTTSVINILPSISPTGVDVTALASQFYRVTNPETTNSQIVHFDTATGHQQVIKTDVILGDNVFVLSGNKVRDKIVYTSRAYGIFQDPGALSETRTGTDRRGGVFEYNFYFNHTLKRFTADNTASESVIFEGSRVSLGNELYDAGIVVIDGSTQMFLNPVDINDSYVQLNAFNSLADPLRNETTEGKLQLPLTVRLSDGAMTQGRTLSLIKNATTGVTNRVLVNFIAPHIPSGIYPVGDANKKRLQSCTTALVCTDVNLHNAAGGVVGGAAGNFFFLGKNTGHVYLTKAGSATIFAYDKINSNLHEVTGVTYPAIFTPDHHLMNTGGYGSNLNFFTSLADMRSNLSEGNTSFIAINYDLDTNSPIGTFFGSEFLMYKHAQILKITGTIGVRVFDNGDGIDHMNASTGIDPTLGEHISLAAVKNGKLFLELVTYTGSAELGGTCTPGRMGDGCTNLRQGMIDTTSGIFPKTDVDTELGALVGLRFLRGNRIPPVAVGNYIYIAVWDPTSDASSFSGTKAYDVYKVSLANPTVLPPRLTQGRMYFERTASRSSGVYEGHVILWNSLTNEVTNATTGKLLGLDSDIETKPNTIVNVIAAGSTNILAGTGGLFGLRMFTGHGGTKYLVAGKSAVPGSLQKVNRIRGNWIVD